MQEKIVFISRGLERDSAFRHILKKAGWEVIGESLVQLTPLSVSKVPPADWWFFSSRNAVRFFLPGRNLPPLVRLGALGPATAEEMERQTGHTPDFVGNGDPATTAKAFFTMAKNQVVVFPGAVNSLQSVQTLLAGQVQGYSLHVYDNTSVPHPPDMTLAKVLVFTSPLNAQTYFKHFQQMPHQSIVAIGESTLKVLKEMGLQRLSVAESPNETALAEKVLGG